MRSLFRWMIAFLTTAGLSGCTLGLGPAAGPQAWIDAPLDGMVLPLAPYEIVAHASDATGISRIEFNVNGAVIGSVPAAGPLFTARQSWSPAAPGEYVIQARGANSGGIWSEYAEVTILVQGEAVSTPEPTVAGQTPAASPTPSEPIFTLVQNGNCRRGPSQVYEPLTSLLKDQVVRIIAANEESTWWLVKIPSGELCWISAITGTSSGNTGALPLATAGPPPEEGCYVYDPNQNPVCTVPCPSNASPGGACSP